MTTLQVRDALSRNLSDLINLPDPEAAEAMNERMSAYEQIERIYERSYAERTIIVRQFESRGLWKHLVDPDTDQRFPNLTAWLSCSSFLGCRRVNFEAMRDGKLLADVPESKLIDVPKGNIKLLTQLSTAVRNDPGILEAAKTLSRDEFEEKVEKEQPHQHIEAHKVMRFSPGRSWAKTIEDAIRYAMDHGIADTRDEALLRMAETSMNEWGLEQELRDMPAEEAPVLK
jgi:hypothetical protein